MSDAEVIDLGRLRTDWALPEPSADGDKHDRGTILVIGGAASTPGAVMLAGLAALRVGAGRLSMATVQTNASAVAVEVPEAAVTGLATSPAGGIAAAAATTCADLVTEADAVLVGPGMTGAEETRLLVTEIASAIPHGTAVVLDAMALTCGAADSDEFRSLAGRAVITPNENEARRLLGDTPGLAAEDFAAALADTYGVVSVVGSRVAAPDGRRWCTLRGNVGLGTSGSGDVLAGIAAGLAARGASPAQAAVWALTLHSGAGDRLARRVGAVGFLARELLDELPRMLSQDPMAVGHG